MTTALFILTAAALIVTVIQNQQLTRKIAALSDRQNEAENRLDKLSRKARKQTNVARKHEQKIERLHRQQREQKARQDRLANEQTKQAAQLRKLQFRLEQATADIEAAKIRLSSLYSLLDIAEANRAAQMPGSPADYRYQKQITTLQHSISIAERQYEKAKFDHAEATIGISQAA